MMFSRIFGLSFASAATDVVISVFALADAAHVAAVVAGHVLHFHVVAVDVATVFAAVVAAVGDAAHKAIAVGGGTTRSLGARENL